MAEPMMNEDRAANILLTAIKEGRAAEFLHCLFDGGSATVDTNGMLVLASGADIMSMIRGSGADDS